MTGVLEGILAQKMASLQRAKETISPPALEAYARRLAPTLDFSAALRRPGSVSLVGEMKRSSPSAGPLREPYRPAEIAGAYRRAGARALSVLTEEDHFGGRLEHMVVAKTAGGLPVLRKDFIVDAYQLFEARVAGADAILLIVRLLKDAALAGLIKTAASLGLDALVEVHDEQEMDRALAAGARVIGVNSRNLSTLAVDTGIFDQLLPRAPVDRLIVAESGIKTPADVARVKALGAHAMLVGESLLRQADMEASARALVEAGG